MMKRPPVNTQEEQRQIECLEILDSDEVGCVNYFFIAFSFTLFELVCTDLN